VIVRRKINARKNVIIKLMRSVHPHVQIVTRMIVNHFAVVKRIKRSARKIATFLFRKNATSHQLNFLASSPNVVMYPGS